MFKSLMKILIVVMFVAGLTCPSFAKNIPRNRKSSNHFDRYQKNIKEIDAKIAKEQASRVPREKWIERMEKRKKKQQETIVKLLKTKLLILQKNLDGYKTKLAKKTASGYSSKLYEARIKTTENKIYELKKLAGKAAVKEAGIEPLKEKEEEEQEE
jgi:hypothetical protein